MQRNTPALLAAAVALTVGFTVVGPVTYEVGRVSAAPAHLAADAGADADSVTSPAAAGEVTEYPPDPGDDAGGFFDWTWRAMRSKDGWMIASSLAVLVTFMLRHGVRRADAATWLPGAIRKALLWLGTTDKGGIVLSALVASLGGFAHAVAAGEAPTAKLVLDILQVWLGAIGTYVALRKGLGAKPSTESAAAPQGAAA